MRSNFILRFYGRQVDTVDSKFVRCKDFDIVDPPSPLMSRILNEKCGPSPKPGRGEIALDANPQ
jgi:hypothetical protein